MDELILLVEDDLTLREVTARGLRQAGFEVQETGDGRDALDLFRAARFDAVVLDIMLPSLDGYEVCRQMRRNSSVPIVMITARVDTADVVIGLESGADDYVPKPFEVPEVVARLRAVLRRVSDSFADDIIWLGDLEIHPAAVKVLRRGKVVPLTAMEFRLLLEMAHHPGQVLTRSVLLDRVWGYDYLGDSRLVDMAVKRLRNKIENNPSQPRLIETVRGLGYRLNRD